MSWQLKYEKDMPKTLFFLFILTSLVSWGVPARRGVTSLTLADGSQVRATLIGDERGHYYRCDDGRKLTMTASGLKEGVLFNPKPRRALSRAETQDTIRHIPVKGEVKIPVVLVQYQDVKFMDPETIVDSIVKRCDGTNKSVRQYFLDQSQGQFRPQFDIYGPITLSQDRDYYGRNDSYGTDRALGQMVIEGCQDIDDELDFSAYDNDHDGTCDVVIIIYAGEGENCGRRGTSNTIWPCQWTLSESEMEQSYELDGVEVDMFAVFNEAYATDPSGRNMRMDGIGTFCHEFSHCLGLPDLYTTDYSDHFGMDVWSIMDRGCYNDDSYTPAGYSAFEKHSLGWISLHEPVDREEMTLQPTNGRWTQASGLSTEQAMVLYNPADSNEYYIFETRAQHNWDQFLPGEGLMVTHVTYDAEKWYNNEVNNYDVQGVTLVPADGSLDSYEYSLEGDLYPYEGNDRLTDLSDPASTLNLGDDPLLHYPVLDIVRNADGSISFSVQGKESGIDGTVQDDLETIRYYDLMGREIQNPQKGIYIKKQGHKAVKEFKV